MARERSEAQARTPRTAHCRMPRGWLTYCRTLPYLNQVYDRDDGGVDDEALVG